MSWGARLSPAACMPSPASVKPTSARNRGWPERAGRHVAGPSTSSSSLIKFVAHLGRRGSTGAKITASSVRADIARHAAVVYSSTWLSPSSYMFPKVVSRNASLVLSRLTWCTGSAADTVYCSLACCHLKGHWSAMGSDLLGSRWSGDDGRSLLDTRSTALSMCLYHLCSSFFPFFLPSFYSEDLLENPYAAIPTANRLECR